MKVYVVNIAAFTAIGTATAAAQFLLIVLFLLAAAASNTNCTNIVVAVGATDSVIKSAIRTEQPQDQQKNHQSYHGTDQLQDEEFKTTTKSPTTFLNIDNSDIFLTATKINVASSVSSSSSSVNDISFLVFKPSLLDFKNQPVGDAFNDVVTIFNKHTNRSVYLGSISGTVPDFYSSFFEEKVIPPLGNTTFNVVFLPRQPGDIQTSLLIHTSFGVTNYTLRGRGVECIFRLSPLVGLKAPFNSTLTPEIVMYNPYDIPLQIVEVYSSGGKFQLELPSGGSEAPQTLWEIPPFSSKPVIRVRFKATSSGNHTAYVRIKVSAESKPELEDLVLVVPIEVEIDAQNGIYTEIPMLNFGIGGETDRPKKISLNLFNSNVDILSDSNGGGGGVGGGGGGGGGDGVADASDNKEDNINLDNLVEIEDYMVEASDDVVAAVSVHIAKIIPVSLPVPASFEDDETSSNKANQNQKSSSQQNDEGPHHKPCHYITATIDWSKLKTEERVFRGHIAVRAHHKNAYINSGAGDDSDENHRRKQNNQIHRIPFIGEVLPGSIYYNESYTQFLTGTESGSNDIGSGGGGGIEGLASATDRSSSNGMSTNSKTVKSTKNFIIKNNFEFPLAITNITVDDDTAKYFKISGFIPKILATQEESQLFKIKYLTVALKRPLTKSIWLHTNTSLYEIGLKTYTGLLRRIVPVDENTVNGGVGIDERAVNFGTLPISTVTDTVMAFVNDSPIPITIHNWTATISDVASIYVILRGCGNLTTENLKFCYSIPPKEWIFFQVSVLSNAVGTFFGKLAIKTDFEELVTPVRFSTAIGQLQFTSALQGETKCFPGGVCSVNLTAHSTFIQPMTVKEILVNVTGGVSYSYSSNQFPAIEPNEVTYIGQLQFTPKALCGLHECYVAFPDQWHPTVLSTNCRNKEPDDLLTKILEEYRKMKSSFSSIKFRVTTNQVRRHDFNGSVDLLWPKLVDASQIEFPVFQVGEDVFVDILVTNPIDQPINVYFMMHDVGQMGTSMTFPPEIISHCWDCFLARENVFSFVNNEDDMGSDERLSGFHIIPPYSSEKITVKFLSQTAGTFSNLFYIRNNFTVLEAIWITAIAAPHQFKFGNRKPGSVTPLVFELSNKHFRDCDRKQLPSNTEPPPKISAKRTFTAKNTGDEPIDVYGMYIEGIRCVGYGFRVLDCWNFRLPPNSSKKVEIVFTPDFTLSRVSRVLSIDTSLGYAINYTLLSLVPAHALNACAKILRRPSWEHQLQFASFIVLSISFLLVIIAAFFDSDKVLKDHVNNMSKDKGPVQPTLDLRQVGLRNSSLFDDAQSCLTSTTTIVTATATATSVTSPVSNGVSSGGGGGGGGGGGHSNNNNNQGKPYPYLRKKQLKKTENQGSAEVLPCSNNSGNGGYGNNKKSWATVLARKFSPIKSDVKFREVTPSPAPASTPRNETHCATMNSCSKKENAKKHYNKDLIDTTAVKKSIDDDSSSTTTETSTVSSDTPSTPMVSGVVPIITKKPTSPSKKSSILNESSTATIVEITTPSVIIQKSKTKTSVKKTKSLPLNGASTKEISNVALEIATTSQQQNSLTKNTISPPAANNATTTKTSNNRTIDTRSKINVTESSITTTLVKDSYLSTPPSGQNAIDQNQQTNSYHQHHHHNHQSHHHQQQQQQQQQHNQQDHRPNQSNIKKHGKTPGRERRKNDSVGASGGGVSGSGSGGNSGNVNGRKSSHSKLTGGGTTNNLATTPKHLNDTFNRTAFQFSSPLSNNNIGFGINNNNPVTSSSVWDTNRVSFSNIVAQTPYYSGSTESGFSVPQSSSASTPLSPQQLHLSLPTIHHQSTMQSISKSSSPLSNNSISNAGEFSSVTLTPISTRSLSPPPVISSTTITTTTSTTAVSLAQNLDGSKMPKKNLLQFFGPVEDSKFIDLDLLMKSIERSMSDVLLTNTKPTNTTVNDLGPIGTRKSPSSTPVWEPLPNIQKPIAVTTPNSPSSPLSGGSGMSSGSGNSGISGESGRNNPNSFFSGEFPQFSNSSSTNFPSSTMDNMNNAMCGNGMSGLGGISGLLDNVYEQDKLQQQNHQKISSSKRNNWDQETFLSILQQIQQSQIHQNQNQQPLMQIEQMSSSSSSSSPQPPPQLLMQQQQQQQQHQQNISNHHQLHHTHQQHQQHNSFDQHSSLQHIILRQQQQQQEQQLEHQEHQQQQQVNSFYSNDLWSLGGNGVGGAVGQDYSQSNGNWLQQGLIRPPPGIDRVVQPRYRYRNGDIQDIVPLTATNGPLSSDNIHNMQSLYHYPQQSTNHHQNQIHHSHHHHHHQNDAVGLSSSIGGIGRRFNDTDSAQYLPQYNPFSSLSSIWSSDPWTTLMPSTSHAQQQQQQQQSPPANSSSSSSSSPIAVTIGGGNNSGISGGNGDRNISPETNLLSATLPPNEISK